MVINPPNLPGWHNYPLADEIRRLYPAAQVKIDNDANAAALAEAKWGAGRGYRNVFYATIGTGIGTGFVFDGKVYHGRTGSATEGGHRRNRPARSALPLRQARMHRSTGRRTGDSPACSGETAAQAARCGTKSVLLEMAGGKPEAITSEMVAKAYGPAMPLAKEVMKETLDLLAYWLGNVVDLVEPDVIVIGGGVSSMLAPFLDEIRARWVGACLNPYPQDIPLVLAHYKEDAGIAGAAALCDTN